MLIPPIVSDGLHFYVCVCMCVSYTCIIISFCYYAQLSFYVRFYIRNILFRDYVLSGMMLFSSRDGLYLFPSENYQLRTMSTTFKDVR